jgi:hypothetical protein
MKLKFSKSQDIEVITPWGVEIKQVNSIIINTITIYPQLKTVIIQYYKCNDDETNITTYKIESLIISDTEYENIENFNEETMLNIIKTKENIKGKIE